MDTSLEVDYHGHLCKINPCKKCNSNIWHHHRDYFSILYVVNRLNLQKRFFH